MDVAAQSLEFASLIRLGRRGVDYPLERFPQKTIYALTELLPKPA
jgi:hypothetical protein